MDPTPAALEASTVTTTRRLPRTRQRRRYVDMRTLLDQRGNAMSASKRPGWLNRDAGRGYQYRDLPGGWRRR